MHARTLVLASVPLYTMAARSYTRAASSSLPNVPRCTWLRALLSHAACEHITVGTVGVVGERT
jgi:hypothetical protein